MSYKTDRLTALFPDAYGARDTEAVIYKLLDAIALEFMEADARLKDLLKSHWVPYATGAGLDGLGSVFGVTRRILRSGQPESDAAFRRRLQGVVPFFTGGGTVEAVKGAVRSALGLPFDLDELAIPPAFAALQRDIEHLIHLSEFSPDPDRVVGDSAAAGENLSELVLVFDRPSVGTAQSQFQWTVTTGTARKLSLERLDTATGVRSIDSFALGVGETLRLTADADRRLSASIGTTDVSSNFLNLDGSTPPRLPAIPDARSEWRFRASGGFFNTSVFDTDVFNRPDFHVEQSRVRLQPLTFDVEVPFFLQDAVAALKDRYHYPGELLVFESLPPESIQGVIDETRAAGVRGSIRFSLNFYEVHTMLEAFSDRALRRDTDVQNARESLIVSNVNQNRESHQTTDRLAVGGVFDIANFDGVYGFQ
jgi:hypothetical protein